MLGDEKTDDFFKNRKASCDFCCYSENLYLSNLIGPGNALYLDFGP